MPQRARAGGRICAAFIAVLAVGLTSGCGRDYDASSGAQSPAAIAVTDSTPYHGVELQHPIAKADATLVDTSGKPFNLARDTAGRVVLLYAGYTHCPDVCPTTVADLAAALRGLPAQQQSRVTMVMYSTDPVRDTPSRLRAFLDQFNTSFVGVTGDEKAVIAAINSMGIDVEPPVVEPDGDVQVEHGAQVLAFTPPTNTASLLWTSGTTVAEYQEDLSKLLAATK
jgi:protein SCO1